MSDFAQLWGPILQARGAGQALDQLDRTRRLEARVDPIGTARPGYMNPIPEAEGTLRQGARSVAAIDVDFTPKFDELNQKGINGGTGVVLPAGTTENDLLRWDGNAWVIMPAPTDEVQVFLSVKDGVMIWQDSEGCEE